MKVAERFLEKFSAIIIATLGCFDRVIIKGYLPFRDNAHLNTFVDYKLKMRRKDFLPFLEKQSQELVARSQIIRDREGLLVSFITETEPRSPGSPPLDPAPIFLKMRPRPSFF